MIRSLTIKGFKSLADFSIQFANFNCIIGLNGSGKSTLLQAIDFLAQLMHEKGVDEWLKSRNWKAAEMKTFGETKRSFEFEMELYLSTVGKIIWKGTFGFQSLRCTIETVTQGDETILDVREQGYRIGSNKREVSNFKYQGSILSQLKDSALGEVKDILAELRSFVSAMKSLDLLAPHLLRQRARAATDIGVGGEKLSAFLSGLSEKNRDALLAQIKEFYPKLFGIHTNSTKGWKTLSVSETYGPLPELVLLDSGSFAMVPKFTTEARHINDGMLRLMAILAEMLTEHKLLLFDEIENGINPELIEKLMDKFCEVSASQQIIVTTHSPMILNYLTDEVAKKGVILLFKTEDGYTHSVPFFDLPSPAKKLSVMGPGEVFVDTRLEEVAKSALVLKSQREGQGNETSA